MNNVKSSIDARSDNDAPMGEIAAWFESVTRREAISTGAFQKTLDNLLEG
ncbi:hypothetical protein [Croceicoccus ponticola]|nr:hypothetical protein [Croceicoccus ponticola]